jgi:hypothetical protein
MLGKSLKLIGSRRVVTCGKPAKPPKQSFGVGGLHAESVESAGTQELDERGAHFLDRAGGPDAHVAPPLEQPNAFIELNPAGALVAEPRPTPNEFGVLGDRGNAPAAVLLQNDLVIGVDRDQHRHEIVVEPRRYKAKLHRTSRRVPWRVWVAGGGIFAKAAEKLVYFVTVLGRRLNDERQIDVLALDFRVAAHVAPQAGVFGEGTGLGRRYDGKPIRGGLAGDDAADVGRLLADRVAGVRFGLDPVDERGEPTVATKFQRNGLGHETVSAFPVPFGRLIERSSCGRESPVRDSGELYVRKWNMQGKT